MKKKIIIISVILVLLVGSIFAFTPAGPALVRSYYHNKYPSTSFTWGTHKNLMAFICEYKNGKWISESDKCLIYDIESYDGYLKNIVHYFNNNMRFYKVVQNVMPRYSSISEFYWNEYDIFEKSLLSAPDKLTYEFNWLENGESKTRTFVSDYYLMWTYEDDKIKLAVSEYAGSPDDITITMIHSSFEISGGVLVEQYFIAGETEADEDKLYIAYTYLSLAPEE